MPVSRWWVRIGGLLWLASIEMICSSCGADSRAVSQTHLPDPAIARRAVESSLESWQNSPDLPTTSVPSQSIVFVDQQRRQGQRLREFKILGESETENCWRFQVKLTLTEPEESKLVVYFVFGQAPLWVYRSEDFDMIMHWECLPPADSTAVPDRPRAEDEVPSSGAHR